MANFDVVSLFTKILVFESLSLISNTVDPETLELIKICLSSTFFTFKGVCYKNRRHNQGFILITNGFQNFHGTF